MFILIGAPIYDRAWILPDWFAGIVKQDIPLSDIGFIFVVAKDDISTMQQLMIFLDQHPEVRCFDIVEDDSQAHSGHPEGHRIWTHDAYMRMVNLRNKLLAQVVCHDPERFFSLDSDILLEDPRTLRYLVQLTHSVSAVSPLLYMTPDSVFFPSTMSWIDHPGGKAARLDNYPIGEFFQTDIIMAAKMMTRDIYQNVHYEFHPQGEDLGWSYDAGRKGYGLFLASSVYCPHIMSRASLAIYKNSGDARKPENVLYRAP